MYAASRQHIRRFRRHGHVERQERHQRGLSLPQRVDLGCGQSERRTSSSAFGSQSSHGTKTSAVDRAQLPIPPCSHRQRLAIRYTPSVQKHLGLVSACVLTKTVNVEKEITPQEINPSQR